MAKSASKLKMPTRDSEEEAAEQRMIENGRSILTMWIIGFMIQENRRDFQLTKECLQIISIFSCFTNLAESGIDLSDSDMQFLRDFAEEYKCQYLTNNIELCEGINCRDLWKICIQAFWRSHKFIHFESKFASKIVIPLFKKENGATLVISDNLFLLDKLTKYLKHLSMRPTLTQRMSSFYASSGLSPGEKGMLLFSGRKEDHLKHQLKIGSMKLKSAEDCLKEDTKRTKFLQDLLDSEQLDIRQKNEQIIALQQQLDAANVALQKYGDARIPECLICRDADDGKSGMKLTNCCGQTIHESCFATLKIMTKRENPNCPNCRNHVRELVRITENHTNIRRMEPKKMKDAETTMDHQFQLEAAIGGPEIEPLSKPSRPPSIYALLLELSSSAENSKSPHRRDPPAARAYA